MPIWDLTAVIFGAGFVQTLLTGLLLAALKIKYDRKLETLRFEMRLREQAAIIAQLFAEWNSKPTDPMRWPEHFKRLNQLACEVSIWLPAPIVRELSKTLTNAADHKQPKEILIEVRTFLRGEQDDLTAAELVHFEAPLAGAPQP